MGKTFRKVVACSTNDFAAPKNDKIRGWVENNGGKFTLDLTSDVTHLLCSPRAWKQFQHPALKAAWHRQSIHIVSLRWLEDSLLSQSRKPLPTGKYSRRQRFWRKMKPEQSDSTGGSSSQGQLYLSADTREVNDKTAKNKSVETAGIKFDKACKDSDAELTESGYHLYLDATHFAYSLILTRPDIHDNRLEQHRLKLYESDRTPHTYTAFTTYVDRNGKVAHDTVAPVGSTFDLAKDAFKTFFKLRTGVEWESAPLGAGNKKREDSPARERTLSHDGAGDWTYQLEYEVEEWKKGARKPSVTMVVSAEDAGEKKDVRARTPEGGW